MTSAQVVQTSVTNSSFQNYTNNTFVCFSGWLSEDILARRIDASSRTTSRSTTVSEKVISALSSTRPGDEMILQEKEPPTLAIHVAMMARALKADKVHTEAVSPQMIRRTTELTVNRVQIVLIPNGADSKAAAQGEK